MQPTISKKCSSVISSSKVAVPDLDKGKDNETTWKEEIRSRLKDKTPKKKVYGYIKDIHALDDMGEERGTIKNIFFGNRGKELANSRQETANHQLRVTKHSLVPTRASKNDPLFAQLNTLSIRPKSILPNLKVQDKKNPFKPLSLLALDNTVKRLTLMQIKEKATILKNVHDNPLEEQATSVEQAIFKKITLMLENHLTDEDNLFRVLFQEYQVYFITKYEQKVQEVLKIKKQRLLSDAEESDFSSTLELLSSEVLEFIQVMVKCLILFYNFDVCYFRVESPQDPEGQYVPCTILNFDNLMNFAAAIMFPKRVYELVLEYFVCRSREKDQQLFTNMNILQNTITMDSLEISEKFQLRRSRDDRKKDQIKTGGQGSFTEFIGQESGTFESRKAGRLMETTEEEFVRKSEEKQRAMISISVSRSGTLSEEFGYIDDPYHEAIRTLKYINEVESPLEKMKVLLLTVRKIIKAINDFYKGTNEKQEVLMGDQIMSLVVYVVLKSKCPNLVANLDYIETFLPSRMFSTFSGYYLTVFHAASEYIASHSVPEEIDTSPTFNPN